MAIPSQDLLAHHLPLLDELKAAALRVIASGRYIMGEEVAAFERELAAALGVPHAVGVSSGTDALLALLMAIQVGPGDEVITTPYSFFATAGVIARLGAMPVFADVEPDTLTLDPARAARLIGRRTRAVITVHLFGRPARVGELAAACAQRGVALIEDAAQAIGAHSVGQLGMAAALSFFPAKNLGALGDAGAVVTRDADVAKKLRLLRAHGAEPRYHHHVVGGNFRLDEIQAAFLRAKLPHLPRWTSLRRQLVAHYRGRLAEVPGVHLPPEDPACVWNQLVVRVPGRRDDLARHLADRQIATAIYYPVPLHLQTCFKSLGHGPGDFPVAEAAAAETLALPLYPELSVADVERVCDEIAAFLR